MGIFDRDWYRSLWFGGKHPPACTCCDCNEGVKRKSSREAQSVTDRLNQELLDKDKIKEGGIMANRQKQPPINLEEEEEPQEEGRGPISYAGGETEPRGSKLKVPKLVKRGPALGILQIFIPILVAVVISFLLINAMAVNKGTYSSGIGALQASVDGKIAAEDAKITNVINNYASKSEISGFVKAGDLSGYMRASDLSAVQQQVTTLQASVGSLSGGLTQAQVQAMITQALGSSATYVTKAQMDTAISAAVTYLRGLIGSEGVVNYSFLGSGDTYALLVGPSAAGNYTGEVNITYVAGNVTRLTTVYTSSIATFYSLTQGLYTPTVTLGTDTYYYLTGVTLMSPAYSLTASQVQYITLKGLYGFGVPSGVGIK